MDDTQGVACGAKAGIGVPVGDEASLCNLGSCNGMRCLNIVGCLAVEGYSVGGAATGEGYSAFIASLGHGAECNSHLYAAFSKIACGDGVGRDIEAFALAGDDNVVANPLATHDECVGGFIAGIGAERE